MVEKHKKTGRIKKYEILLCLLILGAIAAGLILPGTGPSALPDEFCNRAVLWIGCIYVMMWLLRKKKYKKSVRMVIMALCVAACVWIARDPVRDLAKGPRNVKLSDIQTIHSQSASGILSSHYYLTGTMEDGERLRVEISSDDCIRMKNAKEVRIEYYPYTGRVRKIYRSGL